jgi:hypothetical protein
MDDGFMDPMAALLLIKNEYLGFAIPSTRDFRLIESQGLCMHLISFVYGELR